MELLLAHALCDKKIIQYRATCTCKCPSHMTFSLKFLVLYQALLKSKGKSLLHINKSKPLLVGLAAGDNSSCMPVEDI